jgi:formylmethanofuran dehydrogenase subunit E
LSTYYTADLNADINRYLDDEDSLLRGCPICDDCGEPAQESYFDFDGHIICDKCMEEYRRWPDDIC